jgi:hypothetical protein
MKELLLRELEKPPLIINSNYNRNIEKNNSFNKINTCNHDSNKKNNLIISFRKKIINRTQKSI